MSASRHAAPVTSLPPFRDLAPDGRPAPSSPYGTILRQVLDELFSAYPTFATDTGYHGFDDRWPDLSASGRQARIATIARLRKAVRALPEGELSPAERIDREILDEALASAAFDEERLREAAWDPLSYVTLLGDGLFALLAREYAPWSSRGAAFAWRVARIPDVLQGARANLVGTPDRPVSLLHTDTALEQLEGITELIDQGLEMAAAQDDGGLGIHGHLLALRPAAEAALADFRTSLESEVRPRASGEGRLGPSLFREKLRHTLASDLAPEEMLAQARRDYDVVRAEIVRLAREAWPHWRPDEPRPEDPDRLVRGVLDAIAQEHRRPDELLGHCEAEVGRIEAFVREHGLIGLPDEPLRLTWTPTFLRAHGGAFLSAPGPLDVGQASYFWITPPGDDWPPERVESYLREDNDRMLRLLCIHEAVPGHFLQLAWAKRSPNLTRSVFQSGVFIEGWAVYVTQVMMDAGYGLREPALLLNHWKFYLRAITNAIIDVLIHTEDLSEGEAMDLMVKGGFQEEQEARAKWLRARLTSTQLSTYYLGSLELWDLEAEARRRAAIAAGADPMVVPAPRVVGDLGETPGFDYRAYLESAISQGSPPVKWLRRVLLDEAQVEAIQHA